MLLWGRSSRLAKQPASAPSLSDACPTTIPLLNGNSIQAADNPFETAEERAASYTAGPPISSRQTGFSDARRTQPLTFVDSMATRVLEDARARGDSSDAVRALRAVHESHMEKKDFAEQLKAQHLNRNILVPLLGQGKPLRVSYAEVGPQNGSPVVVFLGPACVRYWIAVYEEYAIRNKLRLLCFDRWGIGKTDMGSEAERGVMQWARVVETILDMLAIDRFQILAHSLGIPYALALSYRLPHRVIGRMYLLSPWLGQPLDPGPTWQREMRIAPSMIAHGMVNMIIGTGPSGSPPANTLSDRLSSLHERRSQNGSTPSTRILVRGNIFPRPSASNIRATPSHSAYAALLGNDDGDSDDEHGSITDPFTDDMAPRHSTVGMRSSETARDPYQPTPAQTDRSYRLIVPPAVSAWRGRPFAQTKGERMRPTDVSFIRWCQTIMRASCADAQPGAGVEVMSLLVRRTSPPWGFSLREIGTPLAVWWGDRDGQVAESAVRWLERELAADLQIVPGAYHSLVTHFDLMREVFARLAQESGAAR